jgi:hypothetical protein
VTLQVTYAPKATNAAAGTLTLNSNSSTNPTANITMTGTGVVASSPQLTVNPTSLNFGDVALASNATLGVTLTSTGSSAVTVNSATISGSGFTVSGASFPVTLSPQQAVTLQVKFAPTSTSSATGTLTVSSNVSTIVVNLSGTGSQHQVNLSWQAPGNSPVTVSGYNIYRATGNSSSYQLLNSSIDTQTTYVDSSVQSGTVYTYYVESVGSSGTASDPSSSASVTIP